MKQYPNYQVDRNHKNCGPQIHVKSIMNFIQNMLSAETNWILYSDWKRHRSTASWAKSDGDSNGNRHHFAFTRALIDLESYKGSTSFYTARIKHYSRLTRGTGLRKHETM